MKKQFACSSIFLLSFSIVLNAQNTPFKPDESSGTFSFENNTAENPCISSQQYIFIEKRCTENRKLLGFAEREPSSAMLTTLNWPLKPASSLTDCSYYSIGAYVDHNPSAGQVTDYNCSTKTYDGHGGTDIGITPFGFYKMDNNLVEVVAAAAGTILDKADGNFDRNCSVNNLPANYVIIQHADGSRAIYWHLKKNSVTTKSIGQTVAVGEYLGVVGSSGSSSGPHLHFEVWNGSSSSTRIDPYAGSCNFLNPTSWWAAQKPYTEPAIIKASVHTTDIVLPGCPITETLNESRCFELPFQGPGLPAGAAKFYVFMRNETNGMTGDLSILNPNGSVFSSWTFTSTNNLGASWRGWTKTLPNVPGTYTFRAVYNGISCTQTFDVTKATIAAGGSTTFCQGNSVMLLASAGSSYLWSNSATTQNISVSTSGSYKVTVTNANGCSAVSSATTVTVNPLPNATVTAGGPVTFCQGNSVTLTASAGSSYLWSNSATTQSITVSASGSYKVTVTNANGCSAVSSATSVVVNPLPATPSITANGALLHSSYATGNQWYLNGIIIPGATMQSYTAVQSGNYTVVFTNANACASTSAIYSFINTGIEILSENEAIIIFPNPNMGKFTVKIGSENSQRIKMKIEIFNTLGYKVFASDITQQATEIDISPQPKGIYFVRIKSAKGERMLRVLKFL